MDSKIDSKFTKENEKTTAYTAKRCNVRIIQKLKSEYMFSLRIPDLTH